MVSPKKVMLLALAVIGLTAFGNAVQAGPPDLRLPPPPPSLPPAFRPPPAPLPVAPPPVHIIPFPSGPNSGGVIIQTPGGSGGSIHVGPGGVSGSGQVVIPIGK